MMSSFTLISFLMLVAAACTHGEIRVKDTEGNPLRTTAQYLILPVNPNSNGGGLLPVPVRLLPLCPLGISQASVKALPGMPVSFSYPYVIRETYINENEVINIEFKPDVWPGCEEFSKYWEVDEFPSASEEPAILTGGTKQKRNSWFKIERKKHFYGGVAYKLTTLTGTIGTVPGPWENAPQLVLTNDTSKTFLVKFQKVHGDTTTSRLDKLGLRMFPSV